MNYEVKALNERYQEIAVAITSMGETAKKENRSLNSEENFKFDKLHAEGEDVLKQIEQIRKQADVEKNARELLGKVEVSTVDNSKSGKANRQAAAFSKFLRHGNPAEYRAESEIDTTTSGHGSEWVPISYHKGIVSKLVDKSDALLAAGATVEYKETMESTYYPVSDDTSNYGEIHSETGSTTNDDTYDPTSSRVLIKPFTWDSKWIKVTHQSLRTIEDLDSHVQDLMAGRQARGFDYFGTLGNGSTQPQGLVGATSAGKTSASATVTTWNEFLDLKHSVSAKYRDKPTSGFMFSDATLLAIKKLSLSTGAQLWTAGNPAAGVPALIDGNRYTVNNHMASVGTASNKFALYGDFSKFQFIVVNDATVIVAREKFIDTLEYGYLYFNSFGCNLIDDTAVKHMIAASS